MNKNKMDESLNMDYTTYKKVKGTLDPKLPINITGDKPLPTNTSTTTSSISTMEEQGSVIGPQDTETIKYLSNVKDEQGKVSQPFTIGEKSYQMVRGITPKKQVVLGVYCHNDLNEAGENIIHHADHFENTIAKPMREKFEMSLNEKVEPPKTTNVNEPLNLGNFKHFIVDVETGKFKKFETIDDLAKYPMSDNEKYMGLSQFKKFFHDKIFGATQKQDLSEIMPTGSESGDDMVLKAQKLMKLISKKIPRNAIETIKTNRVAQTEVIAAFAELIGVPRSGLAGLVSGIKDLAKTPVQGTVSEGKTIVKTIKVKDIK